jgi:hypothetical protein
MRLVVGFVPHLLRVRLAVSYTCPREWNFAHNALSFSFDVTQWIGLILWERSFRCTLCPLLY